jgi:hypothetical protein
MIVVMLLSIWQGAILHRRQFAQNVIQRRQRSSFQLFPLIQQQHVTIAPVGIFVLAVAVQEAIIVVVQAVDAMAINVITHII